TPRKFFYLERNRWLMLLWNLRWATLAALGPGLAVAEGMAWAYAGLRGPRYLAAKARSYAWLLTHGAFIRRQRAAVQRRRRVGDDALLACFTARLPAEQLLGKGVAATTAGGLLSYPFAWSLGLARRVAARARQRARRQ